MTNKIQVTFKKPTPHRTEFYVSEVDEKGRVVQDLSGPYLTSEQAELEIEVSKRKTGKARMRVNTTSFDEQVRIE